MTSNRKWHVRESKERKVLKGVSLQCAVLIGYEEVSKFEEHSSVECFHISGGRSCHHKYLVSDLHLKFIFKINLNIQKRRVCK